MQALHNLMDMTTGAMSGAATVERRLSDLRGSFADADAYEAALALGDPVVYSVASVEAGQGAGDLHYGLGRLAPGQVGGEYYLTRGHLHHWRPAAEVYVGLSGEGLMLLEDEATGESCAVPLAGGSVVYVPGGVFHRTVNTGGVFLVYLGVYPAQAGHDYGALAERNFRQVVVEVDGRPVVMDRQAWLQHRAHGEEAQ